ncbi:conserved protein of unknown function [Candidatus Hydrogenisulfobacillus filiaventi]|uniref:Uncharacterized protein n=1 Tax=Candidatus Hydrogenisulfobacillus filiaventi TaxID=2707344 RepID=A0A6F8ZDS3_9FIRM|nr:conserved protein of unknown function [Candidatus Hydrogenisulfobacillus filiaventi]
MRTDGLPPAGSAPAVAGMGRGTGFRTALNEALTLSRHAAARLQGRLPGLDPGEAGGVPAVVDQLRRAGARKAALVLPASGAILIVAPQSRTLITALDLPGGQAVVTAIDAMAVVGRTPAPSAPGADGAPEAPHPRTTDGMPAPVHWRLL